MHFCSRAGLFVLVALAGGLAGPLHAQQQQPTGAELAAELVGRAVWVDEFYRQSKCKRVQSLPPNSEADVLSFVRSNLGRMGEGLSWADFEKAYVSLRPTLVPGAVKDVRARLQEAHPLTAERCAELGGYAFGMLFSAKETIKRRLTP